MSKNLFHEERESEIFKPTNESPINNEIARRVIPIHLTKGSMEGNAETIADLVKSGNYNALDVATKLQWMIATLEQARKMIQQDCVSEIEKHNGKATINGAEVIKKETGVKYLFDGCDDAKWKHYDNAEEVASEFKKEREKFLKTLTAPLTVVDEQTGEVSTINPPLRSSTTNIQVSFK